MRHCFQESFSRCNLIIVLYTQVEIYMERVRLATDLIFCVFPLQLCFIIATGSVSGRDLFDLSKDNIQIKEHKSHGILCQTENLLHFPISLKDD